MKMWADATVSSGSSRSCRDRPGGIHVNLVRKGWRRNDNLKQPALLHGKAHETPDVTRRALIAAPALYLTLQMSDRQDRKSCGAKRPVLVWLCQRAHVRGDAQAAASPTGVRPFCLIGDLGEFIGAGDKVINYGTMSKTPTEPACDWVAIWTPDEGMIRHCWMVMDTATAFLKLKRLNPKLVLG